MAANNFDMSTVSTDTLDAWIRSLIPLDQNLYVYEQVDLTWLSNLLKLDHANQVSSLKTYLQAKVASNTAAIDALPAETQAAEDALNDENTALNAILQAIG